MDSSEADAVTDLRTKAITAVKEGDAFALEELLTESDLDLTAITADDGYDRSLLMLACFHKRSNVMKWMLSKHLNVTVEMEDKCGHTALQWVCFGDGVVGVVDLDIVRVLLESFGADVEHCDRNGYSALCHACQSLSLDVLRYLTEECDADMERVINNGYTAIRRAYRCSSVIALECLCERFDCDVSECVSVAYGEIEAKRQYMSSVWQLNVL